jgi:septum formation protein
MKSKVMPSAPLHVLQQPILLATQSPRRKQLMQEAGFQFRAKATHVDESFPSTMPVEAIAEFLAQKKATAARDWIENEEIILAADSVVLLKNKVFEKPQSVDDAHRMLSELSGQVHRVITGVCFANRDRMHSFSSTTSVHFEDLSPEEIEFYVRRYQPFDKAGSYGVQEWLGHCKVKRLEGSFTNVMGLPMYEVYHELGEFLSASTN